MNNERLQEIKALIHSWVYPVMGDEDRLIEVSIFQELIAALEAAQQQLAEAQAKLARSELTLDYVREEWKNDTAVADLRKQLAEAREIGLRYLGQVGSLEKQLAASQAEVGKLHRFINDPNIDVADYYDTFECPHENLNVSKILAKVGDGELSICKDCGAVVK